MLQKYPRKNIRIHLLKLEVEIPKTRHFLSYNEIAVNLGQGSAILPTTRSLCINYRWMEIIIGKYFYVR